MNRRDLQELARTRLQEAKVLLNAGHHSGAYYLAGYSIECALKACIAKLTMRSTFPDKKVAERAFTHSLRDLIQAAGLQRDLDRDLGTNNPFQLNWQVVKDWKVESRYQTLVSVATARDMVSACGAPRHGVLAWVRERW